MAAVVYSSRMDLPHGVGPGFMPPDRHAILQQIATLLAPELTMLEPLPRIWMRPIRSDGQASHLNSHEHAEGRGTTPVSRQSSERGTLANLEEEDDEGELDSTLDTPDQASSQEDIEQEEKARKRRQELDQRQELLRRTLGHALAGPRLIRVWHQTDRMRLALLDALDVLLGPADVRQQSNDVQWNVEWQRPELHLRVETQWLGALGSPLTLDDSAYPRFRERWHRALLARADEVAATLRTTSSGDVVVSSAHPAGLLVEIGAAGSFSLAGTDPKPAMRIGAAAANHLSQFIVTELHEPGGETDESELAARTEHAWRDLFRQFGTVKHAPNWAFTRRTAAGQYSGARSGRAETTKHALPTPLHIVGVWLIQHNRRGSLTGVGHQLPVVVHLCSDTLDVLATAPGLKTWLPYKEALLEIERYSRKQGHELGLQRRDLVAPYIERLIEQDIVGDTLLLVHAQNLRQAWPWLANKHLTREHIQIGQSAPIAMADRPGLRVVRVRTSQDHETPEGYGEDATSGELRLGLARGLWQMGEHVFASTTDKPRSFMNLSPKLSKATHWGSNNREPAPGAHAWNPSLVELTVAATQPGDEAWVWAAVTHELRLAAMHFDDALLLPLPLHLAKLAEEYVLPLRVNEVDEQEEEEEEEEGDTVWDQSEHV